MKVNYKKMCLIIFSNNSNVIVVIKCQVALKKVDRGYSLKNKNV